jgi:hypothetical protein
MDDLISRHAAIDIAPKLIITLDGYEMHNQAVANYCVEITQLPYAQPEIVTCDRCVATKLGECIWHNAGATYCSLGEVDKFRGLGLRGYREILEKLWR